MSNRPIVDPMPMENYLASIENTIGTRLFQQYYAKVDGVVTEVIENGDKACSLHFTSILVLNGLLDKVEITVHRTLRAMEAFGWFEIGNPKMGSAILWKEKLHGSDNPRKHIGFYVGKGMAVSNVARLRCPARHDYKEYDGRGVESMYWHPLLDQWQC